MFSATDRGRSSTGWKKNKMIPYYYNRVQMLKYSAYITVITIGFHWAWKAFFHQPPKPFYCYIVAGFATFGLMSYNISKRKKV